MSRIGAEKHEELVAIRADADEGVHGGSCLWIGSGKTTRNEPRRRAGEPDGEIHEMREMMPEEIVRPAAPIAGGTDVLPSSDDEAALDQADPFLSARDPIVQPPHI